MKTFAETRNRLLQMHFEANVGHVGGNLSCLQILYTLYHEVLTRDDVFILSKGHAAGALYAVLWSKGVLSDDDLKTFHQDGTKLAGHPPANWIPQIPFATGSLGHGLPLGCGVAMAKKLKGEAGRVFVLMSDGEWQEGSNWEALIFARRHLLPLKIVIDNNGLQGFDTTDVVTGDELSDRLFPFDPNLHEVFSYPGGLLEAIEDECSMIALCKTTKGDGVPDIEDKISSHYLPLTEEQYRRAVAE